MAEIEKRANLNGHKIFYSEAGEVEFQEVDESHLLFRQGRKNADKGRIEIRRLVVCLRQPVKETRRGIKYFVPPSHKRKKSKFFRVVFSCQTVYELKEYYDPGWKQ